MCGIHGIIGGSKSERNADDFLKSAFVANTLRGMDASGLAVINGSNFDTYKLPIAGQFFRDTRVAQDLFRQATQPHSLAIGHVRHGTSGGHGVDTAHPFECWSEDEKNVLVGVHNGTLTGWASKPNGKYYSVDSEWALNHIMLNGEKAFEDIDGAFCFVWWDDRDSGTLNIALNKERPMHVVMLKNDGMAFASEAGMLYWLLERHNIGMEGSVLELQPDHWYKFPIKEPGKYTKSELPAVKRVTYTAPSTSYSGKKTCVEVVSDLLGKFTGSSTTSTNNAKVSPAEYRAALDFGIYSQRVKFVPITTFAGGTEGIVTIDNVDYTAHVLGYSPKDGKLDSDWQCSIIGLDDSNPGDPLVLLDTPMLMTPAETIH